MEVQSESKPIKVRRKFEKPGFNCGCLALPFLEECQNEPIELPLKKILYDIQIINGIAEVSLSHTYINEGTKFLELQYRFPVNPSVCIHKFTATFTKTRMEGVVKQKQEARLAYEEAVKIGKKAAFGEIDSESKDIMILQIGNLAPGEEVIIQLCYTEGLSVCLNTFYQFNFSTNNSPRYVNSIPPQDYLNAFRNTVKTAGGSFEWDFRFRVKAQRKIILYKSSTHDLNLEWENDQRTEYSFTLAKGQTLSNAFSFYYTTENFELPSYAMGSTDAGSSVMISFIPKFCSLDLKDAELAATKAKDLEIDIDGVKGQYIFLLDRSGSMGGNSIQKAKEALILFLKSLPIDTYFQVVSFGSNSQEMFEKSQKNGNQSITKAIEKIQNIDADMGGTQIYQPLQRILKSDIMEGYPKQIFLLTDGEVSNTEIVIDLVRKNTKYSRVHTIGIGSGVSQALIKGCAEKGKGRYIFIRENEDPNQKIIQLLNDSLTPVISKVSLIYDKEIVDSIIPNPEKIPYILKGEIVNFYIAFKGQLSQKTTIALSYTDSLNNLPYKSQIQVSPNSISYPFVDKMGIFRKIQTLQESEASNGSLEDYLYLVKIVDKKQEIIDLSIKHQILSKYTAFICVEKELVDGRFEEIADKGKDKVQIVTVGPQPQIFEQDIEELKEEGCCGSYMENYDEYQCCEQEPQYPKMQALECYERQCEQKIEQERQYKLMCDEQEEQVLPIKGQLISKHQQIEVTTKHTIDVKKIVKSQLFEGYWNNEAIINELYGEKSLSDITNLDDKDAAITYLIVIWFEKFHPQNQYSLIIKKARSWLKKQKRYSEFPSLFDLYLN